MNRIKSYISEKLISILKQIPIPFTKNQRYDLQTKEVIRKYLKKDSNCVDVGCYKGEILQLLIDSSPNGHHFAFEPIPNLFDFVKTKFADQANFKIFNVALSNICSLSTFNYVVSNPSYSGLIKRKYDTEKESDTTIEVRTELMDRLVPETINIDLIKIDVEGAELLVLTGAQKIIARSRPLIIFEHGKGASDYYGYGPKDIFWFFERFDMKISTIAAFLRKRKSFTLEEFEDQYYSNKNYYFIAHR